jgi:hypothetical protein
VALSSGATNSFQDFGKMTSRRGLAEVRREIGIKKPSSLLRAGPSSLLSALVTQQHEKETIR